MNAIILGATGATGRDLLELLLQDGDCNRIDIFVRRVPEIKHEKLVVHVVDFEQPDQWKHLVKGDVLFSCMGTTLKTAGSKEAQKRVDYDYQLAFARAARENDVKAYVLVSSVGASKNSPVFYSQIKGQLEDDVKALHFEKLIIFNPPLLIRKNTDRNGEKMAEKVIVFLNRMGLLKSATPLSTETLAKAMVLAVKKFNKGVFAVKNQEIAVLTKE